MLILGREEGRRVDGAVERQLQHAVLIVPVVEPRVAVEDLVEASPCLQAHEARARAAAHRNGSDVVGGIRARNWWRRRVALVFDAGGAGGGIGEIRLAARWAYVALGALTRANVRSRRWRRQRAAKAALVVSSGTRRAWCTRLSPHTSHTARRAACAKTAISPAFEERRQRRIVPAARIQIIASALAAIVACVIATKLAAFMAEQPAGKPAEALVGEPIRWAV